MTGFPYRESALAEATGIAAPEFRAARKKMAHGLDWEVTDRAVWYSAKGFYAVLAELRLVKKNGENYVPVDGVDLEDLQKRAASTTELVAATQVQGALPNRPNTMSGRVERFVLNRFYLAVRLSDGRQVNAFAGKKRDLYRKGQAVDLETNGPGWKLVTAPPRRPRQAA